MPRKSSAKFWKEVNGRRSERWSKVGRDFEQQVLQILSDASRGETPMFENVVYHIPNSKEDSEGRDFTVCRAVGGTIESRSFGVTISSRSLQEARLLHPDIPQMHFPVGTKPETILRRICALFDTSVTAQNI